MGNDVIEYEANTVIPFQDAMQEAKIFANSDMVPAHFKKPENCYVAFRIAERMGTDLFMLMQNLYPVHGKVGLEAKFAIAMFNSSGLYEDLQYVMSGAGDSAKCHCEAVRASTGKVVSGPTVSIEMAKAEGWFSKSGSKWKTMPDMMLRYRAAMFFIRTNCPQVLLGMHSKDELRDAVEVEPIGEPVTVSHDEPAAEVVNEKPKKAAPPISEMGKPAKAEKPKPEPKKSAATPTHLVCRNEECGAYAGLKLLSGCEDPGRWDEDGERGYLKDAKCEEFQQAKIVGLFTEIGETAVKAARKATSVSVLSKDDDQWKVYEHCILGGAK